MVTVVATNLEDRLLRVQVHGTERHIDDVIMVTDPGSFSFPRKYDQGLVIEDDVRSFYVGKIEFGFKDKVDGNVQDKETGVNILAKLVKEGEIYLSNLTKRVWLNISRSGDFSLMNGLGEGLRYFRQYRFLRLTSMFTNILNNGVNVFLGSVVRDIPAVGKQVIPSDAGPTIPSIEALINVFIEPLKIRLARLHLGHVKNDLGIDEFGSFGARVRGIMEVCNPAGVSMASLKFDEAGNIELSSLPPGTVMIDGNVISGILLGGFGAVQSAVYGDLLVSWLLAHTHNSSVGPTSVPQLTPGFSAALTELLSKKVKIG